LQRCYLWVNKSRLLGTWVETIRGFTQNVGCISAVICLEMFSINVSLGVKDFKYILISSINVEFLYFPQNIMQN
jgi:hypothetical protein